MVVRVVSWENSTSNIEFALKDTLNNLITTEQPCSKISTSMAEPIYYRALGLPHPPPANQPHPTHQLHATHTTTEVGPLPAEQITSHTTSQVAYLLILMIVVERGEDFVPLLLRVEYCFASITPLLPRRRKIVL